MAPKRLGRPRNPQWLDDTIRGLARGIDQLWFAENNVGDAPDPRFGGSEINTPRMRVIMEWMILYAAARYENFQQMQRQIVQPSEYDARENALEQLILTFERTMDYYEMDPGWIYGRGALTERGIIHAGDETEEWNIPSKEELGVTMTDMEFLRYLTVPENELLDPNVSMQEWREHLLAELRTGHHTLIQRHLLQMVDGFRQRYMDVREQGEDIGVQMDMGLIKTLIPNDPLWGPTFRSDPNQTNPTNPPFEVLRDWATMIDRARENMGHPPLPVRDHDIYDYPDAPTEHPLEHEYVPAGPPPSPPPLSIAASSTESVQSTQYTPESPRSPLSMASVDGGLLDPRLLKKAVRGKLYPRPQYAEPGPKSLFKFARRHVRGDNNQCFWDALTLSIYGGSEDSPVFAAQRQEVYDRVMEHLAGGRGAYLWGLYTVNVHGIHNKQTLFNMANSNDLDMLRELDAYQEYMDSLDYYLSGPNTSYGKRMVDGREQNNWVVGGIPEMLAAEDLFNIRIFTAAQRSNLREGQPELNWWSTVNASNLLEQELGRGAAAFADETPHPVIFHHTLGGRGEVGHFWIYQPVIADPSIMPNSIRVNEELLLSTLEGATSNADAGFWHNPDNFEMRDIDLAPGQQVALFYMPSVYGRHAYREDSVLNVPLIPNDERSMARDQTVPWRYTWTPSDDEEGRIDQIAAPLHEPSPGQPMLRERDVLETLPWREERDRPPSPFPQAQPPPQPPQPQAVFPTIQNVVQEQFQPTSNAPNVPARLASNPEFRDLRDQPNELQQLINWGQAPARQQPRTESSRELVTTVRRPDADRARKENEAEMFRARQDAKRKAAVEKLRTTIPSEAPIIPSAVRELAQRVGMQISGGDTVRLSDLQSVATVLNTQMQEVERRTAQLPVIEAQMIAEAGGARAEVERVRQEAREFADGLNQQLQALTQRAHELQQIVDSQPQQIRAQMTEYFQMFNQARISHNIRLLQEMEARARQEMQEHADTSVLSISNARMADQNGQIARNIANVATGSLNEANMRYLELLETNNRLGRENEQADAVTSMMRDYFTTRPRTASGPSGGGPGGSPPPSPPAGGGSGGGGGGSSPPPSPLTPSPTRSPPPPPGTGGPMQVFQGKHTRFADTPPAASASPPGALVVHGSQSPKADDGFPSTSPIHLVHSGSTALVISPASVSPPVGPRDAGMDEYFANLENERTLFAPLNLSRRDFVRRYFLLNKSEASKFGPNRGGPLPGFQKWVDRAAEMLYTESQGRMHLTPADVPYIFEQWKLSFPKSAKKVDMSKVVIPPQYIGTMPQPSYGDPKFSSPIQPAQPAQPAIFPMGYDYIRESEKWPFDPHFGSRFKFLQKFMTENNQAPNDWEGRVQYTAQVMHELSGGRMGLTATDLPWLYTFYKGRMGPNADPYDNMVIDRVPSNLRQTSLVQPWYPMPRSNARYPEGIHTLRDFSEYITDYEKEQGMGPSVMAEWMAVGPAVSTELSSPGGAPPPSTSIRVPSSSTETLEFTTGVPAPVKRGSPMWYSVNKMYERLNKGGVVRPIGWVLGEDDFTDSLEDSIAWERAQDVYVTKIPGSEGHFFMIRNGNLGPFTSEQLREYRRKQLQYHNTPLPSKVAMDQMVLDNEREDMAEMAGGGGGRLIADTVSAVTSPLTAMVATVTGAASQAVATVAEATATGTRTYPHIPPPPQRQSVKTKRSEVSRLTEIAERDAYQAQRRALTVVLNRLGRTLTNEQNEQVRALSANDLKLLVQSLTEESTSTHRRLTNTVQSAPAVDTTQPRTIVDAVTGEIITVQPRAQVSTLAGRLMSNPRVIEQPKTTYDTGGGKGKGKGGDFLTPAGRSATETQAEIAKAMERRIRWEQARMRQIGRNMRERDGSQSPRSPREIEERGPAAPGFSMNAQRGVVPGMGKRDAANQLLHVMHSRMAGSPREHMRNASGRGRASAELAAMHGMRQKPHHDPDSDSDAFIE